MCGHQNKQLDDDAKRTIAQTRQYLDDADELLRTENTAVGFFNAKIERYPDLPGRLILWVTARALYGVREHPEENPAQIILNSLALKPGSENPVTRRCTRICRGVVRLRQHHAHGGTMTTPPPGRRGQGRSSGRG